MYTVSSFLSRTYFVEHSTKKKECIYLSSFYMAPSSRVSEISFLQPSSGELLI